MQSLLGAHASLVPAMFHHEQKGDQALLQLLNCYRSGARTVSKGSRRIRVVVISHLAIVGVHIVELMFVVAPHGVVEVVFLGDDADCYISCIRVSLLLESAVKTRIAPVFDLCMFPVFAAEFVSVHANGLAVEFFGNVGASPSEFS